MHCHYVINQKCYCLVSVVREEKQFKLVLLGRPKLVKTAVLILHLLLHVMTSLFLRTPSSKQFPKALLVLPMHPWALLGEDVSWVLYSVFNSNCSINVSDKKKKTSLWSKADSFHWRSVSFFPSDAPCWVASWRFPSLVCGHSALLISLSVACWTCLRKEESPAVTTLL